ncbi:MAG: phage major capsid protein [Porphyromonas sp.]|uniref:phage major capsid family protein n=1 Tax=Porphyromonas sp. TaxID=1924944 RepID=UPI001CB122BA|nr:phage major capsid protein [Porphyromonas sp.]MBF1389651.1 phage major capsid protein [Porphyromonas sp.]
MKFDFSGWATKNDLTCSDGRTIKHNAFKENDGQRVPLVWQHGHNAVDNVLGHALLENRDEGVYAYCAFNDTPGAENAKELVKHGDVKALSIYANRLDQRGADVIHGNIVEVSMVLSGANPGALIDNVALEHSDGSWTESEDEAVIYSGLTLSHDSGETTEDTESMDEDEVYDEDDLTVADVLETLDDDQRLAVAALIEEISGDVDAEDEDFDEDEEFDEDYDEDYDEDAEHGDSGGDTLMHSNIFEGDARAAMGPHLSHADEELIFAEARKPGMTLRTAVLAHAADYGIKNPELLFPDATNLDPEPQRIMRENSWVSKVLQGAKHSPFSRVKTQWSNLTADDLRAKGYVKASRKKDVVYEVANRKTEPTTVYNKTKIDRDDVLDITTFNVVAWMQQNLRMALEEELARAVLIGDGREVSNPDKIKENNIRPIWKDDELFSHKVLVDKDAKTEDVIDIVRRSRKFYKGSGMPVLFTTNAFVCDMLEIKDINKRYIYETKQAVANALNVSDVIEVEVMEGAKREVGGKTQNLLGIIVNMQDYTLGADKGGETSFFEQFDIDFNQQKYLLEARCSGSLTKYKSAIVIEKATA